MVRRQYLCQGKAKIFKNDNNIEEAIELAINEMPEDFVIRNFIIGHKAEVKGMFLTEWNQEKFLKQQRKETENDINERVARDMLLKKMFPISVISEISKLSEDVIRNLAGSLGVSIV